MATPATVTAMPVAAEDLGRIELYAWGFTAFLIAQVLAIVLSGRLSDRKGPVVPLVGGSAIFVIGLLAAGLAPTMEVLLAGRFVQGFGAGTSNVAFMVVFAQAYDARRRAAMMSMLSFCWVLPRARVPVWSSTVAWMSAAPGTEESHLNWTRRVEGRVAGVPKFQVREPPGWME